MRVVPANTARPATSPGTGQGSAAVGKASAGVRSPLATQRLKLKSDTQSAILEQQQEKLELERSLFGLVDCDASGSIQFAEFAQLHRILVEKAGHDLDTCDLAVSTDKGLERQFRKADEDHSLCLDFDEWAHYCDSFAAVLGHRSFVRICKAILDEAKERRLSMKGQFDTIISDHMLQKAKVSSSLHGPAAAEFEHFLKDMADPNFEDREGNTVLLLVAEKADAALVKKLLESGADPTHHNHAGDCVALRAARCRNLPVLRFLLVPEEPEPPAEQQEAAAASSALVKIMPQATAKEVRELLAKKADANYKDQNGWTALIAATFWDNKDCVEAIIKHYQLHPTAGRLKVDTRNPMGRTALHIAARKGRGEILPLLLSNKCDPDLQDEDGWTPLHHAAYNGMDACVQILIERGGANILIKGHNGFTPWMVTMFPTHAGTLLQSSTKLLEPLDRVNMSKSIMPVLNDANLTPSQKWDYLYGVPGVSSHLANLRLHEQCFSVRSGPNKVRLTKLWEGLARDMVRCLRSGETEKEALDARPEDAESAGWQVHQDFLRAWFLETRGPRPTEDWQYDNREAYRAELDKIMVEESEGFRQKFAALHARMQQEESGKELCDLKACEVLRSKYLSQLDAHPILSWLDNLDVRGAFDALRNAGALGPAGTDSEAALLAFMDLLCCSEDFATGADFWTNIYKYWFAHYIQTAQSDFQQKINAIVNSFNERYGGDGLKATFNLAKPMTYEQMQRKETEYGLPGYEQHESRWVASGILDPLSASVVANSPRAALLLLSEFFRPLVLSRNHLELVRVVNNFNKEVNAERGYRDIKLNIQWDGGVRHGQASDMQLGLVGEVRIALEEFAAVKERMCVIDEYMSGEFDYGLPTQRPKKLGSSAGVGRSDSPLPD